MFVKNEGSLDCGIRTVFGVLALIVGFTMLSGVRRIVAGVVGLALLAPAAIGIYPLDRCCVSTPARQSLEITRLRVTASGH